MELDGRAYILEPTDSFSWETDTFTFVELTLVTVFKLYPLNCWHQNHLVVKTTSDWETIFGLLNEIT